MGCWGATLELIGLFQDSDSSEADSSSASSDDEPALEKTPAARPTTPTANYGAILAEDAARRQQQRDQARAQKIGIDTTVGASFQDLERVTFNMINDLTPRARKQVHYICNLLQNVIQNRLIFHNARYGETFATVCKELISLLSLTLIYLVNSIYR